MAAVSEQTRENERLRKILELSEKVQYQLIVGEVIGRDAKSTVSDTIVANRGSRQGVLREMPVVTPIGIVGMTIAVDLFTSKVQLVTDAGASVGAMLQKDRTAGILSGTGNGRCILRYLPINVNAKGGDLVVTSGQDGVFPEGLPVGRVGIEVKESPLYKSLEILPFQNVSSLAEVVFLSPSRQTIATLPAPTPKSK
jgi:rod shape-determining protein MreC